MHMMAHDLWERGVTSYKLMDQWGLSLSALKQDAAEASRRLEADEDLTPSTVDRVNGILHMAMGEILKVEDPVRRAGLLLKLAEVKISKVRIETPQKLAITDSKGDDIPPAVAAALSDPIVARLYLATNLMPTDAEVEAERAKSGLSVRLVTYLLG